MAFNRNTIRCEHPTILLDPRFDKLALKYGTVVLRGHRYPLLTRVYYDVAKFRSQFYPRKCDIQYDDIDSCYFLNQRTGEHHPLYMVVPCGKCTLCRNRKSSTFAARCVAELAESTGIPLFVTFTYAPEYYPANGLNRLDMQMFFKRLRQRLEYYGFSDPENPLRYTYVGEYGSHTKRAYYHTIIFNFPSEVGNIAQIQKFIQRCWSRFVFDPETGKRVPLLDSDGNQLYYPSGAKVFKTVPIGWTKTLPVTSGCVGYVAKYIRKVQQVPSGCNNTFHCSSNRNGGIGAAYIRKFRQSFMENPDMTSIPVLDRISGKTFYIPIDSYVKNLFIPTSSRLFSRSSSFLICLLKTFDMVYMGSKNRIAKELLPIITRYLTKDRWYVEPFCGGCNMIDKVKHDKRIANDYNKYLIALFKALQDGIEFPTYISKEEYDSVKQNKDNYPDQLLYKRYEFY